MISGDDYTRLRDKLEPILALAIVGFSIFAVVGFTSFIWPLAIILAVYTSVQVSWPISWWLGEGRIGAFSFAGVTFLRGFARTAGLCMGIFHFIFRK